MEFKTLLGIWSFVVRSWNWCLDKLGEKILSRKHLVLVISAQDKNFELCITNPTKQTVAIQYSRSGGETRPINIYCNFKGYRRRILLRRKDIKSFEITAKKKPPRSPVHLPGHVFYEREDVYPPKRDEFDMFYFSPNAREVFPISDGDEWRNFFSKSDEFFLIDSEGGRFYLDKDSITRVKSLMN